MTSLPTGWAQAALGDITETRLGKMLSAKARVGTSPGPYLRNRNVQWDEIERFTVLPGDVLVCEGGEIGRTAIWKGQLPWVGYQKALHRIRPARGVSSEYLAYFMRWFASVQAFEPYVTGSTIKHLPQEDLRLLPVPVPPEPEQRRIVAAIEEQFSRLEVAEASLCLANKRLALLKAAALRAGLEGDWPTRRLDEIATTSSGGTPSRKRPDYFGGSIPWVKSGELRDGHVKATDETISDLGLNESSAKVVERGTLLIALYGATVGKLGVLDIDAATNQAVCAIMSHDAEMVPYLWLVLRQKRSDLIAAGQGGAQPNISQAILRKVQIPVPSRNEQRRVVAEVERQLSFIDAMRAWTNTAIRRSVSLRRAILERAFTGMLVQQDPSEEPASALLQRIAAMHPVTTKSRRRKVPA